jgi:hypothetical protein
VDFDLNKLDAIADPFDLEPAPRPAPPLPATPRTPPWRGAVVVAAALLLLAGWISRSGLAERPTWTPTFILCAFGLPFCASLLAMVGFRHRGRFGLGLTLPKLVAIALLAAVGFVVSVVATPSIGADVFTLRSTLACAVTSSLLAALPLLAGFALFRRSLVGNAAVRTLLFGLGCALIGALLIRLHCAQESRAHLLVAHGAALPLFGCIGALLGRRQMCV